MMVTTIDFDTAEAMLDWQELVLALQRGHTRGRGPGSAMCFFIVGLIPC